MPAIGFAVLSCLSLSGALLLLHTLLPKADAAPDSGGGGGNGNAGGGGGGGGGSGHSWRATEYCVLLWLVWLLWSIYTMTASAACLLRRPIAHFRPPTASSRALEVLLLCTSLLLHFGSWIWLVVGGYDSLVSERAMRILLGISFLLTAFAHSWYGWMVIHANRAIGIVRPLPMCCSLPAAMESTALALYQFVLNLVLQLSAVALALPALFLLDVIPRWVQGSGLTLGMLWICDAVVLTLVCRVVATCRAYGCFRPPQAPPSTSASSAIGAVGSVASNPTGVERDVSAVEMQTMHRTPGVVASTSTRLPPSSLPELRYEYAPSEPRLSHAAYTVLVPNTLLMSQQ